MMAGMSSRIDAARSFMATHARLLDQRRFGLLLDGDPPDGALAALAAYRNGDGGYGWGLEPDLRSPESQPVAAMHALEVLGEAATPTADAASLCDWLYGQLRADGGLPFALPVREPIACAPFWVQADPTSSNFQMTVQVAAGLHTVAAHDAVVADHPVVAELTGYCVDHLERRAAALSAYELKFALGFVDAAADVPEVAALVEGLSRHVPADGVLPVEGGSQGEVLHPLDLAPRAGRPSQALFSGDVIAVDRQRLAARQQPDGGWTVGYGSASVAGALEWRGYATVAALVILGAD